VLTGPATSTAHRHLGLATQRVSLSVERLQQVATAKLTRASAVPRSLLTLMEG